MPKPVVIFGSSAHARVIIDNFLSRPEEFSILGFIESDQSDVKEVDGREVLGKQGQLKEIYERLGKFSGIIAIGDNFLRKKVADQILSIVPDFEFVNAIHSSVVVSPSATIGRGNVVMPGVIINSQATIGSHCIINTRSSVEHNCQLMDYSSISAGVTTGGYVTIGLYSAVALGVTIFDRTCIGENVVIGSGSLVTKDIGDNVLAYGVPAKVVRTRKAGEKFLK